MNKFRSGFTLIEVALAVLVVAIGLLAVVALFSHGLTASNKAVADTHASMFAGNVFNGLRARSLLMAERQTLTNKTWMQFWTNFVGGTTSITVAAAAPGWSAWTNVTLIRAGGPYTQVFGNASMHGSGTTGIVNHAFRYRIDAWMTNVVASNLVSAKVDSTWYNWWTMPVTNDKAMVTLYVWDGKFGGTNVSGALMFHSEFANQGDL